MGRSSSIHHKLPLPILEQLHNRLIGTQFGQYEDHVTWLSEQGFDVSKSALHRYAVTYEAKIRCNQESDDEPSAIEARLRCLEVASKLGSSDSSKALIKNAEELLKWLYSR
ncbi:phage protein Gp27 family protein [Iodobacter sp. BJB302]|uniref:phage protein Gp27 family protein n=1 Tax=Iodobacter sp. BJB302 TaxID=1506510 RepID=UPI000C0EE44C|nr:phage protein Gp27 family protein [Iodobacter sp. BJB302]PHV02826.1 hypothetical protein CSQ88_05290 [Iodobacter sp. BJB302]